jgi:TonB family protein
MLPGAALKSTVVIGAAWILALALRRHSAAARHAVWTAAAAALLALPLLSISMPAWRVRSSALGPLASTVTFRATAMERSDGAAPASLPAPTGQPASKSAPFNFRLLIPLVWAAGTAFALLHMVAAWMVMARQRSAARPLQDCALFPALRRLLGIRHHVALLEIPARGMPLSFGILHPAVFLPADAREWSEDRRRVVLLHELAHIRRGDLATQVLARIAVSLYWWNPLAWMVWREFVKERERAADDVVLAAGETATSYASELLAIARSLQAVPMLASAAVAMARPSQFEGRLMAILDTRVNRRPLSPRAPLAAAALAVALVAPFAALQAQDKPDAAIQPNIDATIKAAIAQQNHEILDTAAAAYTSVRKYDAAQQLLQSALTIRAATSGERSSAYAIGLMKLGDLSASRGKTADAVDFYTRAVALGDTPDTTPGLIYLGTRALGKKDPIAAEGFVDRALSVAPSGKEAGRALTVKGNIALFNELPGVAELSYQQALAQDPPGSVEAALTMETYARFLHAQNRHAEANMFLAQAKPIRQAQVDEISTHLPGGAIEAPSKVGNGVLAPALRAKQEPEYSEDARSTKMQGTVMLRVTIGTDGLAHDIELLRNLGFGLDEKAVEAVSQWKFTPGTRDGVAVPVEATIEVNFRLL